MRKLHSFVRLVLPVTSAVVLALAAGCAGSSGDPPTGQSAPAAQTAPAANAPASNAPADHPPQSNGDTPSPKQCAAEGDCAGACPPEAKGCTCADGPQGKACLPTCAADQDCPSLPGMSLVCSPQKVCTPKS